MGKIPFTSIKLSKKKICILACIFFAMLVAIFFLNTYDVIFSLLGGNKTNFEYPYNHCRNTNVCFPVMRYTYGSSCQDFIKLLDWRFFGKLAEIDETYDCIFSFAGMNFDFSHHFEK